MDVLYLVSVLMEQFLAGNTYYSNSVNTLLNCVNLSTPMYINEESIFMS